MVSFSVSPFEVLVDEASLKPITRPPRRFTAVSKLSLVRVEGSKNSVATTLPSRIFWLGFSSKCLACASRRRISSFDRSLIETRLDGFIVVCDDVLTVARAKLPKNPKKNAQCMAKIYLTLFRNSKYFFAIKGLCYRKVLLLLRLVGYQGQRVCYAPRDQFANSLLQI